MTDLEIFILNQAYNHFVNSNDFNGLANYNLQSNASYKETIGAIISLIDADYINIADSRYSVNPHIIYSIFPSKEEQKSLFDNTDKGTFCIYPSEAYLKTHRNIEQYSEKPFDRMMALGFPQLKALYFTPDVLVKYSIDPRFHFTFNDYYGSVYSTDDNSSQEKIFLETFGIGRNGKDRIIVSFPRCLRRMSSQNQLHWAIYQVADSSNCRILQGYLDNVLHGNWNFIQTVYRAILQEIENISVLTIGVWGHPFFRETFKKEELEGFDMLFLPTKSMYNQFIMLLEKITVSNIDDKFFDTIKWDRIGDDGKTKGSLLCLKEWLGVVTSADVRDDIVSPLKELRHERQSPAHVIENNKYSTEYSQLQNKYANSIYGSLNLFRRLLQTNPKTEGINLPHDDTRYYEI